MTHSPKGKENSPILSKEHIITKEEAKFLIFDQPNRPHFYHLPKINKRLEQPPGTPIIARVKSFTSTNTGRTFQIREFNYCKSVGLVYLCKCTCSLEYVSKTKRALNTRIGEHLSDIRHKRDTPLARHIWENHEEDNRCLTFCVIERVYTVIPEGENGINTFYKRKLNGYTGCGQYLH